MLGILDHPSLGRPNLGGEMETQVQVGGKEELGGEGGGIKGWNLRHPGICLNQVRIYLGFRNQWEGRRGEEGGGGGVTHGVKELRHPRGNLNRQ